VLFFLARLAFNLGLIKVNTSIHYIESGDAAVVLTPLAGSSSIRSVASNVKSVNMQSGTTLSASEIYVLDRSFAKRMQSFFNKKVRNPTNMGKIILLASCPPLHYQSTAEEFNQYLISKQDVLDKDKHLYSTDQVVEALSSRVGAVKLLTLANDKEFLQELLGVDLSRKAMSTEETATFAPPLKFKIDRSLKSVSDE